MSRTALFPFAIAALAGVLHAAPRPQDPEPAKGPDKEVAAMIETLKDVVADKKFARDDEGVQIIDKLLQKLQAGVVDKDRLAITKSLDGVLMSGPKVRPHDNTRLYVAAAAALGQCGVDGAKVLKNAYVSKRFPEKPDWVPFREHLLRNLGKTKDESMVEFLCDEARVSPEAGLQAAAGEALGNFEESKEAIRKSIVSDLLKRWGELAELADQTGSGNIAAQNARDRLAALSDKWNTTLAKLTRQNFHKFREWQTWHNKNKNLPW
jgi:hypothetical protein